MGGLRLQDLIMAPTKSGFLPGPFVSKKKKYSSYGSMCNADLCSHYLANYKMQCVM